MTEYEKGVQCPKDGGTAIIKTDDNGGLQCCECGNKFIDYRSEYKNKEKLCPGFKAEPDGSCFWYKGNSCRHFFIGVYDYTRDKLTICPHGEPQRKSGEIEDQKRDQVYWEAVYKNNKPGVECKNCGWKCRELAKYCEKCEEEI